MNTTNVAIDTNIMLYSLDDYYPEKQKISRSIIATYTPVFCSQNLSEFINVCSNRWRLPKSKVIYLSNLFMNECSYFSISRSVINHAVELVELYDFQIFDSIIIAAALDSNCEILYSEDMHSGLVVQNRLTIINPFK